MKLRDLGCRVCVLVGFGLLCTGCGSSRYFAAMPSVERTEPNINRVLRGARRVGCKPSEQWDSFMGVSLECKEGRMMVGHPSGKNMDLPGKPVEIGCFDGLGNQEDCEAMWQRIYAAGEPPCKEGESGAGCGPLECTFTGKIDHEPTCEEALDPYSPKYCPECKQ